MGKLLKSSKTKKPTENIGKSNAKKDVKSKKKSHILKLSKPTIGFRKILSKKEKQKAKNQLVREKIELTKEAFKEDKARKRRQKTAVVGDLKPLLDSLPSLDELLTIRDKSNKTGISSIDR